MIGVSAAGFLVGGAGVGAAGAVLALVGTRLARAVRTSGAARPGPR